MKFYDRKEELSKIERITDLSKSVAQMTFIVGRRRIGKTKLITKALNGSDTLYFFVSRKTESLLCADFIDEIRDKLNIPIYGEIKDFQTLFKMLMEVSVDRPFNLIIDEFQEFFFINPSIYSDMQHYWDLNKEHSHLNLFLCGSVYTLMHKIFEDNKEPLFGRATQKIHLKPFSPSVLKGILSEYNPNYQQEDLLALFAFTGGIPKYVEHFIDNGFFTFNAMVDDIFTSNSLFIGEGKTLLIEEFGKDYAIYFSILASMAAGYTSRPVIEGLLQREIGGYMARLEKDFSIIRKCKPMFAKNETKNIHYEIEDPFLRFWFRFIYKYESYIQTGAFEPLKSIFLRDYNTFSGKTLEEYFKNKLIEEQQYTALGGYWDKKGENEIDIIALDDLNRKAIVAEVKRKKENIHFEKLRVKVANSIYKELSPYTIEYRGFSMEDM